MQTNLLMRLINPGGTKTNLVSIKNQNEAYGLVKDIDKKDLLFVALSIQTGYTIRTGDLKLHKGLIGKGFDKIITTDELVKKNS